MTKRISKKVIKEGPCPQCRLEGADNTGNNLKTYEDGKTWCFRCNDKQLLGEGFVEGDFLEMPTRGIKEDTCRKANFKIGKYTGYLKVRETGKQKYFKDRWVQIASWYDKGKLVAQKIRDEDKNFKFIGNAKNLDLWGIHDYQPTDKLFIVITGGEIDRLSVMQAQGLQYPVVSPPSGEGSAFNAIKKNLKILMQYKYVVLALDNDEAGIKAMHKAVELFDVDRVRIATWPAKDANEVLLEEDGPKKIADALWNAKICAPERIVTIKDIKDLVLQQPQFGLPYPWESMTKITYGCQWGEIHVIVGANGIGKTEFIKDIIFHFLKQDIKTGIFSFEQRPEDTARRLVGAKLGIKLHLPGSEWPEDKIKEELDKLDEKVYLYKEAGGIDIDELIRSISYEAKAKQVKIFVIDNLRGIGLKNNEEANTFMRKVQTLASNLQINIYLLSHVNKDSIRQSTHVGFSSLVEKPHDQLSEDKIKDTMNKFKLDWEDGRIPGTINIDGPSVIADLAHYVWSLARNKNSENRDEARILRVKACKTRLDGLNSGLVFKLKLTDQGVYRELGKMSFSNTDKSGINEESNGGLY